MESQRDLCKGMVETIREESRFSKVKGEGWAGFSKEKQTVDLGLTALLQVGRY